MGKMKNLSAEEKFGLFIKGLNDISVDVKKQIMEYVEEIKYEAYCEGADAQKEYDKQSYRYAYDAYGME